MEGSLYGKIEQRIRSVVEWKRKCIRQILEIGETVREDKKDCGVQCEMSRSNQFYIMLSLLNEGAITFDDLEDFSDDLKDTMKHFAGK